MGRRGPTKGMNRALSRHRAEQARLMRATGATWQEVADKLGYAHRRAAATAVWRLDQKNPPETVEQARRMHDDALRMVQQKMFGRFAAAAQSDDDDNIARYAKEIRATVAERAKLGGAYAPQRAEVDVQVSHDPAVVIDRLTGELLELVAQQPQQQQLPAAPVIDAEVAEVEPEEP